MLVALQVACAAPVPARGAVVPKSVVGKGFAAAVVTTPLQRRFLGLPANAPAVAVILDGTEAWTGTHPLDPAATDWDGLLKALRDLRPGKDAGVVFRLYWSPNRKHTAGGQRVFELAVKGAGYDAGYARVQYSPGPLAGDFDWEKFIAPLTADGEDRPEEPADADGRVRVYPVRTRLSRVLLGGPDPDVTLVDGVVEMITPLDARAANWDEEGWAAAVGKAARAAKLQAGAKMDVWLRIDRSKGKPAAGRGKRFAEDILRPHGFELASYSS